MNPPEENDINWDETVPMLPLRDIVVFPGMTAPLFVGRKKSIAALDHAFTTPSRHIMLASQKDAALDDPSQKDINKVGCVAEVSQILRLPDGAIKALIIGKKRGRILEFVKGENHLLVKCEPLAETSAGPEQASAALSLAKTLFDKYSKLNQNVPREAVDALKGMDDAGQFADAVAANVIPRIEDRQKALEALDVKSRLELLISSLQEEIEILQLERKVRNQVKKQMEKSQRDYYLTEQMKAIQKELGKGDGERGEFAELKDKILKAKMPKEVEKKALKELSKLEQMPPMSAEGTVSRNYIDWLVDVPWSATTQDKLDIAEAAKILDEDHYGLDKVKERILEYLSVRKLVEKMKGPILCFAGPPGVGKTSLGKSIARAMGRKFVRFSLGGVRDEAEIRGHRRTYIGSLPGRIIQSMKKAGTKNPVLMLDEIDKVASDYRGDPAAALLEALDPEQNVAFNDHYLEVDYDLSEVMFITTANALHTIPRPLMDRMEVISIPGYTDGEKENIATKYLIPKQVAEHGLAKDSLAISPEALRKIIRNHTRESGVRNLERELAAVCRKAARKTAEKAGGGKSGTKARKIEVTAQNLVDYLGEIKFRDELKEAKSGTGVATGLAWTELGGAMLKIETTIMDGKGKFILTGKLGDVMKESAHAALSYIRSRGKEFGLKKGFQEKIDIHIHIPEGATPKEGPSAGVTLAVSMVSALLNIPVSNEVAMTGEITLRGQVLAIGGLREKLLAANRAGVKTVLIPEENEKDLKDVPANVKQGLSIAVVKNMDEVIKLALTSSPWKKKVKKAEPLKHPRVKHRPTPGSAGVALN
ncbi:MAG: endopeptidase La [Nitrospinae bacterium]|nr:endopeptidase La [Nitrospinota bacterium]